jgi:hypothetical protein
MQRLRFGAKGMVLHSWTERIAALTGGGGGGGGAPA